MARIELEHPLPEDIPRTLGIYNVKSFTVNRSYVIDILSKLGLMADLYSFEWEKIDRWTTLRSKKATLRVNHDSGAFRFTLSNSQAPELNFSIAESSIEHIARTFMDQTALIDKKEPLTINKISYLHKQTEFVDGTRGEEQIQDAGVIFGRAIDGVPVRGIGGFIMINIAADESVIGGHKVWRTLGSKVGTAKLLEPQVAIRKFQNRLRARNLTGKIRIVKADFCYFEKGQSTRQRYFEPTYAFVFETKSGSFSFPYKSLEVIPAIRNPKENWKPK